MKKIFSKISATFIIFAIAIFAISAQEFNKLLTTSSSIEFSSKGEVVLKAGEIYIPEGYMAVNLRFKYCDPMSGKTLTKLERSNILNEKNKPLHGKGDLTVIPEGKYKLYINGSLGAFAILIYDLEPKRENQ